VALTLGLHLVAQAAVGLGVQALVQMEQRVLQTQAVVVVEVAQAEQVAQAGQVLSSFLTLALNEAQAAQSHQLVVTPSTHLQLQALTLLNF
jgi:hypothetical protein